MENTKENLMCAGESLLKPAEVAMRARCTRQHITSLIRRGVLPGIRISPRVIRVRAVEVDRLLEARK